jgi:hypothetical protein
MSSRILLVGVVMTICMASLFRLPLDIQLDRRMRDYGAKDSIPAEIVKEWLID